MLAPRHSVARPVDPALGREGPLERWTVQRILAHDGCPTRTPPGGRRWLPSAGAEARRVRDSGAVSCSLTFRQPKSTGLVNRGACEHGAEERIPRGYSIPVRPNTTRLGSFGFSRVWGRLVPSQYHPGTQNSLANG